MSTVALTLSPRELKAWPAVDADRGAIVWLEWDQDFVGERTMLQFPFLPAPAERVWARNCPLRWWVGRPPRRWFWFGRHRCWRVSSCSLWTERRGGRNLSVVEMSVLRMWEGDTLELTGFELIGGL